MLAFMGPTDATGGDTSDNTSSDFSFYLDYFKTNNVEVVIRCNNPIYDPEM